MFTVIGVTNADYANGNDPAVLLGNALDAQMQAAPPAGPALRVLAYAVDGTNMETLEGLRHHYEPQGRFHQFYYFNEAAAQACRDFEIELRIMEVVNDQAVPAARAVLLDRMYAPEE
jgi:hypothetical protein